MSKPQRRHRAYELPSTNSQVRRKTDASDCGCHYTEAVVVFDNGTAFSIDEVGIDEASELVSCDAAKLCATEMLGRRITNIVICESIPTLVVLANREA